MRHIHFSKIEWVLVLSILSVVLLSGFSGCHNHPATRGTAQDLSASAAGRAASNAKAADAAAVTAAGDQAKADALTKEAIASPTAEKIKAAADARVQAAAAKAVAKALEDQAKTAADDAQAAAVDARKERDAEAVSADNRHWTNLCRWIGLGGIVSGFVLGAALAYFAGVMIGVPVGSGLALLGMLVTAFGATVTWLPLVMLGGVLLALVIWGIAHHRGLQLCKALSCTIDAQEGKISTTVADAKLALGKALDRSGLRRRFDALRAAAGAQKK